VMIG